MKRRQTSRLLIVGLLTVLALCLRPASGNACSDTVGFCPCSWGTDTIPVWALTEGVLDERLQTLTPTRSAAEWEQIIMNSLNIYREQTGIPVRFWFAGHVDSVTPIPPVTGIIVFASDTCDTYIASASWSVNSLNWTEIASGRIQLRKKTLSGGTCQTITWDPRLLPQVGFAEDPVNALNHELGHTLGLHHPDNFCGQSRAAVMNSSVPNWGRHFTRDDKASLRSHYGIRSPIGKTWEFNAASGNWSALADWSAATSPVEFRPSTVTSLDTSVIAAWSTVTGSSGYGHSGRNTATNTWNDVINVFLSTHNSPATVFAGSQVARLYYWWEWSTSPTEGARKRLCYKESSDSGKTWGSQVCPTDPDTGTYIMSRRDGIAVAFDWHTKNYIVVWNEDGSSNCDPYCNQITGMTQPGPGSSLSNNFRWDITGHHSFSTPSVACRNGSTASDRCLIAFSTSELNPRLRWVEGGISAGGVWSQTADRAQTIYLDHSPSVAWSDVDSRFHIAVQRRAGHDTLISTYYKNHSGGASWTGFRGLAVNTDSMSGAVLGTIQKGAFKALRMYYMRYQE